MNNIFIHSFIHLELFIRHWPSAWASWRSPQKEVAGPLTADFCPQNLCFPAAAPSVKMKHGDYENFCCLVEADSDVSRRSHTALTYFLLSCWTWVRVDLARRKEMLYLFLGETGAEDTTHTSIQHGRMRACHQTAIWKGDTTRAICPVYCAQALIYISKVNLIISLSEKKSNPHPQNDTAWPPHAYFLLGIPQHGTFWVFCFVAHMQQTKNVCVGCIR